MQTFCLKFFPPLYIMMKCRVDFNSKMIDVASKFDEANLGWVVLRHYVIVLRYKFLFCTAIRFSLKMRWARGIFYLEGFDKIIGQRVSYSSIFLFGFKKKEISGRRCPFFKNKKACRPVLDGNQYLEEYGSGPILVL